MSTTQMTDPMADIKLSSITDAMHMRVSENPGPYFGNPKLNARTRYGLRARVGHWMGKPNRMEAGALALPEIHLKATGARLFGGAYLNATLWGYTGEGYEPVPEGEVKKIVAQEAKESAAKEKVKPDAKPEPKKNWVDPKTKSVIDVRSKLPDYVPVSRSNRGK